MITRKIANRHFLSKNLTNDYILSMFISNKIRCAKIFIKFDNDTTD